MANDYMKNLGKNAGKNIVNKMTEGSGKKLSDTSQQHSVTDTAKDAARATKAAVTTGKVAAKAAAGNYAGAVKDFLKDPKGVIMTAVSIILIPTIIIAVISTTLFQGLSKVFADGTQSLVDEYVSKVNEVEIKSFNKAYNSVSDRALQAVCQHEVITGLGGDYYGKDEVFTNKDTLKNALGLGYDQMRKFSARGNSYPRYEAVLRGQADIFPVMEDESNGFEVKSDGDTSGMTTWTKTVNIIAFGGQRARSSSEAQSEAKTLYEVNYLNGRFNENGISVDMLQMIHGIKFDFEQTQKATDGENNINVKTIANIIEKAQETEKKYIKKKISKTNAKTLFENTYIPNSKSAYKNLKETAYYLSGDMYSALNHIVEFYNSSLKGKDDEEVKNFDELSKDAMDKVREAKYDSFINFMSSEEVYSKLLDCSVSVKNDSDIADTKKFINQNYKDKETSDSEALKIKNFTKYIKIDISVDFCSYDTLGEIFGFWKLDENGNRTDLNYPLLNWILNYNKDFDANNIADVVRAAENAVIADTSSNTTSSEDNNSSDNGTNTTVVPTSSSTEIGWPIDMSANGARISTHFGAVVSGLYSYGDPHGGMDIAVPKGTSIYASVNGKVVKSEYHASYGNYVAIDSTLTISGKTQNIRTIYAHMSERIAQVGQTVAKGAEIGKVGSTGRSTGNHLHFEVRVDKGNGFSNKKETRVDPERFLEDQVLSSQFFKEASAYYSEYVRTIESFFDNCKDAGMATAEILTDAGYVKSSMFWQYKINCFNVMFCASVIDDSKLPFFISTDRIARNDDGSLKIKEFNSCDYSAAKDSFWSAIGFNGASGATYAEHDLNKTYYVVYCQPGTEIDLPFSAQVTSPKFNTVQKQNLSNIIDGNKEIVEGYNTVGALNYMISRLPTTTTVDTSNYGSHGKLNSTQGRMTANANNSESNIEKGIWQKENENPVITKRYNTTDFDSEMPFSYASYCFASGSIGVEIANVQISTPDVLGNETLLSAADFEVGNMGGLIRGNYGATQTVFDYLQANSNESSYFVRGPVILGAALQEQLYDEDRAPYDINDNETYSYFIISVNNKFSPTVLNNANPAYSKMSASLDIYDVFDLDIIDDMAYNDSKSAFTWPLIKSYEYSVNAYSTFTGQVVGVSFDEEYIVVRTGAGEYIRISGIEVSEDISIGTQLGSDVLLGKINEERNVSVVRGYWNGDEFTVSGELSRADTLRISMAINNDSPIMYEDSFGRYTKVLSMMDGHVKEVTNNSLTVFSSESGLYYKYSGFVPNDDITADNTYVAPGTEVGKCYVFDSEDNITKLNVEVFSDSYKGGTYVYYNPIDYFSELEKQVDSARRIILKAEVGGKKVVINSMILNVGESKQLLASIYPKGTSVAWSSDNPGVASVDGSGNIIANSPGIANIKCSFNDGKDGVNASCEIIVPDKQTNAVLNYAVGNNGYSPYLSDEVIDTELSNKSASIKLNLMYNASTFQGTNWTLKLQDGSEFTSQKSEDGKTIKYTSKNNLASGKKAVFTRKNNKDNVLYTTFTSGNAMTENEYVIITATPKDNPSDAVSIKVRIVQPVTRIIPKITKVEFPMTDSTPMSRVIDSNYYTIEPADATYKDVSFSNNGDNIINLSDFTKSSVKVTTNGNSGVATLSITSSHGKNGQSVTMSPPLTVEASYNVNSISIGNKPSKNVLAIGDIHGLSYTVNPATIPLDKISVKWSSSNTSIATVDANTGVVTAKKAGTVTIAVQANSKSDKFKITVIDAIPQGIYLNIDSMYVDDIVEQSVRYFDENGRLSRRPSENPKDGTDGAIWIYESAKVVEFRLPSGLNKNITYTLSTQNSSITLGQFIEEKSLLGSRSGYFEIKPKKKKYPLSFAVTLTANYNGKIYTKDFYVNVKYIGEAPEYYTE